MTPAPSKGLLALASPSPSVEIEVEGKPGESDPDSNPGVDAAEMTKQAAGADLMDAVKAGDAAGVVRAIEAIVRAVGPRDDDME